MPADPGHRPDLMPEAEKRDMWDKMAEQRPTAPNAQTTRAEGMQIGGAAAYRNERPMTFDEQLKAMGADVVRGQRYAMALAIQLDGQAKQLTYTAGMLRQILEPGDLVITQLNQSAQRLLEAMGDVERALRGHQQ